MDNPTHVRKLFDAAVELESKERSRFLDEACGSDAKLRSRLEALLRQAGATGDFLERPPTGADFLQYATHDFTDDASLVGTRVGIYDVKELLGTGGMGEVYLAERTGAGFRTRVAFKVIKRGMDTREIVRRFLREREALSRLEHPNIARLIDGGATSDGLPYLVMEAIDGKPLLEYCNRHRLSVNKRLEVFRAVCLAVQFAHRNLIVHRDLKPTNILVNAQGMPKLLDFGIAKLLSPQGEDGEQTVTTGHAFLTPDYASPEQIRGQPITTASDIYSLGVILYELLAGARPYRLTRCTPAEVENLVCNETPPRPSTAVASTAAGRMRRERPERLRRRLRGDLDNIVLMALRKSPERRYSSAEQLSEDIRRHLAGFPVIARRETVKYRTLKFIQRNLLAVMAAAVIVALLVAGMIGAIYSVATIERERDLARVMAAEEQKRRGWFAYLFETTQPIDFEHGENRVSVSLRDILEQQAERVVADTSTDPVTRARALEAIAEGYAVLRLFPRAVRSMRLLLDLPEAVIDAPDRARVLLRLAELCVEGGMGPAAERYVREALDAYKHLPGDYRAETAACFHALGHARWQSGDTRTGPSHLETALKMRLELFGYTHPEVASTQRRLGSFLQHLGRYGAAETLFRQALEAVRQVYPGDHEEVARVLFCLGGLLQDRARFAEGERWLRQAYEMVRRLYGPEHPRVLQLMRDLALVLKDMERFDEAESLTGEALRLHRRLLGENHQQTAGAYRDHAKVLCDMGELERAEAAGRKAVQGFRAAFAPGHHALAEPLIQLGRILVDRGKFSEAVSLLEEAAAVCREKYLPQSWKTAQAEGLLGAALAGLGRHAKAEPLVIGSFPRIEADRGPHEARTIRALQRAVGLYRAWGKPRELERWQKRLAAAKQGSPGGGKRENP